MQEKKFPLNYETNKNNYPGCWLKLLSTAWVQYYFAGGNCSLMEKNKKIVAIVGMPGSGKSTVVQYLKEHYKLPYIHFGNITIEEIHRRNLPEGQENEKLVRKELRKEHGMAAYAKLSLPKIKELLCSNDIILIDGLYSWSEYIVLREQNIAEIILVSVISLRKNRYQRLLNRDYRSLSYEAAEKRDFAEIQDLEKGGPIALCDYYITNDTTIDNFYQDIEKMAYTVGISSNLVLW